MISGQINEPQRKINFDILQSELDIRHSLLVGIGVNAVLYSLGVNGGQQ